MHRQSQFPFIRTADTQLEQLVTDDAAGVENVERVQEIFLQTLKALVEQVYAYLNMEVSVVRKERVLSFLDIRMSEDESPTDIVARFKDSHERLIEKRTNKLFRRSQGRAAKDFFQIIGDEFEETDTPPLELQLYEDGVELFEGEHVASVYNLRKAIYVDTPMAITADRGTNVFWRELCDMMYSVSDAKNTLENNLLIKRVKRVIGGEAKLVEDDVFGGMEELRYVSEDGQIDIELAKAATGVKTFTYLQRLLQNGYLTDNTLLLIDEPEAHLHPQWIVEYARLLVLINKKLGVKIMIASHNPDMVAAIRSIAEKEEMLGNTHFYLAEKNMDGSRYVYNDLGQEIDDIFRSFNIALDRIKLYGSDSL
ncbi:MAG: ATP-binding protein [Bacteroidaceae bacterium]|nr:ATP-binding protein [Bacteroidaceae bacterium]